jgi:arylsulfatase A-like enzyme
MQPPQRGFEEFFGFLGGSHSYFEASGILRGSTPVAEMDYTTDAFGREACAFVEKHKSAETPWFLYLAFNAVHTPMHATPERLAKLASITDPKRRTYAAMMVGMDDAIGQVRAKLEETGQAGNTLITFMSDNGGPSMPGVTVNGSNNAPLRGSKRTTLEGGIRVPFVIAWPGHLKPGVYEQPVIQLDLHATVLAASGVEAKPEWNLEGTNLLPYLSGEAAGAPHDALYWRFGAQMAIRQGDWKLVRYDLNADTNTGKRQGVTEAKLYRLANDIHEDNDLAGSNPENVQELQAKWDAWNAGNVPALWGEAGKAKDKEKGKAQRQDAVTE